LLRPTRLKTSLLFDVVFVALLLPCLVFVTPQLLALCVLGGCSYRILHGHWVGATSSLLLLSFSSFFHSLPLVSFISPLHPLCRLSLRFSPFGGLSSLLYASYGCQIDDSTWHVPLPIPACVGRLLGRTSLRPAATHSFSYASRRRQSGFVVVLSICYVVR